MRLTKNHASKNQSELLQIVINFNNFHHWQNSQQNLYNFPTTHETNALLHYFVTCKTVTSYAENIKMIWIGPIKLMTEFPLEKLEKPNQDKLPKSSLNRYLNNNGTSRMHRLMRYTAYISGTVSHSDNLLPTFKSATRQLLINGLILHTVHYQLDTTAMVRKMANMGQLFHICHN